jgi:AcrR family transcriptional regulator
MSTKTVRLPAHERRAALVSSACQVFSRGSYRGTTTSELAREAGVTEPILYRHFSSKRDLYLACLDESWRATRELWDAAVAGEPDPALWLTTMGRAFLESAARQTTGTLWVHALAEAREDAEIARYMRTHMRDVQGYVAAVLRRAQELGGIPADRDPDAEAWIFLALGLLSMADRTLGGLMDDAWPAIRQARLRAVADR